MASALLLALVPGCRTCAPPDDDAAPAQAAPAFTVSPFGGFHFDEGDWAAYVFLEPGDFRELQGTLPHRCLVTRDRAVLKELASLDFNPPSGADMATVENALLLVLDGHTVYTSNLILSPVDGLQSWGFGWMEPKTPGALLELVKKFEALPEPGMDASGAPREAAGCLVPP